MPGRREFLQDAVKLGCLALTQCNRSSALTEQDSPDAAAESPKVRQGDRVETLSFSGENQLPFGELIGEGWDGRLYTDLSVLNEDDLLIPNDEFYVRTRYPDLLDRDAAWSITVDGLVKETKTFSLDDLLAKVTDQGVHLLECAGNHRSGNFGLMSAAQFSGVSLIELLSDVETEASATRVLVTGFDEHSVPSVGGHSTPGASWILSRQQLEDTGAFLATHMNGAVLPDDHGYPVRLVNPGWYGCSCIKWVQQLTWVDESAPSTSQMIEYASRTHQGGEPALAKDYADPRIQQAAMPIRVEKWQDAQGVFYRVVGILWGGREPAQDLELSFDAGKSFTNVPLDPPVTQNATWSLWSYLWEPDEPGEYQLVCRVPEDIPMIRLDTGFYLRSVVVDEV